MFATILNWNRIEPVCDDIIKQVQKKIIPMLKSFGAKQPIIL